ncbi:hypothetical protein QZH41_010911, partial [Actinostola sp. cb2023]
MVRYRRRAAHNRTIPRDRIDLELWTVTFAGLAKPHCTVCSSPYHKQEDCPSGDRRSPAATQPGQNKCATTTTNQLVVQEPPASTAMLANAVQPPATQPSSAKPKMALALATKARLQVARLKQDKRRPFQAIGARGKQNPLHHPAFAFDPLAAEVQQYASWSLALNTKRTYQSGEKHYVDFCLMNRLYNDAGEILPASEGTLIYFASFLARTVKHATIRNYLAAVRNMHIVNGYGDPTQ